MKPNIMLKLLALMLLMLPPVAQAAPVESLSVIDIRVLSESAVYRDKYQLGDVAELDGFDIDLIQKLAGIELGHSPLPGRSHRITANQIKAKLRGLVHPDQYRLSLPKSPLVSRASIQITKAQLSTIIKDEITKQFKNFKEVNVTLKSNIKDQFIPKGKASYRIKRIGSAVKAGGVGSWSVRLEVDKKLYKKMVVRAQVEVIDQVVVAKGMIPQGKTIAASDLTTVTKDVSKMPSDYQSDSGLVVGQQARRAIGKNESVRPHLVEEPVILEKGQPVQLVYQTAKIYLSNVAIALRSGKRGELIPVRTVDGKRTVYATVVNGKRVDAAL